MKALHEGTIQTGGDEREGSEWVQKLADEMAEQNHLMMSGAETCRKREPHKRIWSDVDNTSCIYIHE